MNAGLVRATQIPVFTQTQTDHSSLIAANFSAARDSNNQQQNSPPIMDSISASFYDLNRIKNKGRQVTTIIKQGNNSGS